MRKMHPKKQAMYRHAVEGDSLATLSMVYELLDQQQYFYKELVELQERNYQSFLQMLVESTNGRVDAVVRELRDVKNCLQASRHELAEVRREGRLTAKRAECLAEGLVTVRAALDGLSSKNGAAGGGGGGGGVPGGGGAAAAGSAKGPGGASSGASGSSGGTSIGTGTSGRPTAVGGGARVGVGAVGGGVAGLKPPEPKPNTSKGYEPKAKTLVANLTTIQWDNFQVYTPAAGFSSLIQEDVYCHVLTEG